MRNREKKAYNGIRCDISHTLWRSFLLKRLRDLGDEKAMMIPAPRKLSVSCGSAVYFTFVFDEDTMADDDSGRRLPRRRR